MYTHRHYVVYAKQFGGSRFRVNPSGTEGWVGSIEGTTLIYQQWIPSKGTSDIFSYDLVAKTKTKIGKPVSTGGWDYDPTGSGDWVMYSRYYRDGDRKIFLYNTNTHELRRRASTSGRRWILRSSQVNGNYAVWEKTEVRHGRLAGCNVFLYDIAGDTTTKLTNPNARVPVRSGGEPCRHRLLRTEWARLWEERRAPRAGALELGHDVRDALGRARRL